MAAIEWLSRSTTKYHTASSIITFTGAAAVMRWRCRHAHLFSRAAATKEGVKCNSGRTKAVFPHSETFKVVRLRLMFLFYIGIVIATAVEKEDTVRYFLRISLARASLLRKVPPPRMDELLFRVHHSHWKTRSCSLAFNFGVFAHVSLTCLTSRNCCWPFLSTSLVPLRPPPPPCFEGENVKEFPPVSTGRPTDRQSACNRVLSINWQQQLPMRDLRHKNCFPLDCYVNCQTKKRHAWLRSIVICTS